MKSFAIRNVTTKQYWTVHGNWGKEPWLYSKKRLRLMIKSMCANLGISLNKIEVTKFDVVELHSYKIDNGDKK